MSTFRTTSAALAIVAGLLLAGCGDDDSDDSDTAGQDGVPTVTPSASATASGSPTVTPEPSESETPSARTQVSVYFLHGEKVQPVLRSTTGPAVATAAIRALLDGPTAAERSAGLTSSVPDGTELLGLSVADGVATIDLSENYSSGGGSLSMTTRLAQVVFTLTRFPTVDAVNFRLDGEPVEVFGGEGIVLDRPATRAQFEEQSPAVLIESPTLNQTVEGPLRVSGSANVFEGVFHLELRDGEGRVLTTSRVEASSGTGTRGTFSTTLAVEESLSGPITLIAYVNSAKDGSRQEIVSIPLRLGMER